MPHFAVDVIIFIPSFCAMADQQDSDHPINDVARKRKAKNQKLAIALKRNIQRRKHQEHAQNEKGDTTTEEM